MLIHQLAFGCEIIVTMYVNTEIRRYETPKFDFSMKELFRSGFLILGFLFVVGEAEA